MEKTTRRLFMRRTALLAAGGVAAPVWARWLGEQMEKLQPKKHVVVVRPAVPQWTVSDWSDRSLYSTVYIGATAYAG